MSLDEIQQKKQLIESRARIREFVFGIQDGLISTVGLLAGIRGATENNIVVIVTGLTAMISGAVSMAAGSYLSSNAQKDIFDKEIVEAEKLAERAVSLALLRVIGHRVQADVVVAAAKTVKRVQSADRVVPLQDADPLIEVCQTDSGRKPRHARADDDGVVHSCH